MRSEMKVRLLMKRKDGKISRRLRTEIGSSGQSHQLGTDRDEMECSDGNKEIKGHVKQCMECSEHTVFSG